jgi:hypothetical protein
MLRVDVNFEVVLKPLFVGENSSVRENLDDDENTKV